MAICQFRVGRYVLVPDVRTPTLYSLEYLTFAVVLYANDAAEVPDAVRPPVLPGNPGELKVKR